jgi:hypothetical protein
MRCAGLSRTSARPLPCQAKPRHPRAWVASSDWCAPGEAASVADVTPGYLEYGGGTRCCNIGTTSSPGWLSPAESDATPDLEPCQPQAIHAPTGSTGSAGEFSSCADRREFGLLTAVCFVRVTAPTPWPVEDPHLRERVHARHTARAGSAPDRPRFVSPTLATSWEWPTSPGSHCSGSESG